MLGPLQPLPIHPSTFWLLRRKQVAHIFQVLAQRLLIFSLIKKSLHVIQTFKTTTFMLTHHMLPHQDSLVVAWLGIFSMSLVTTMPFQLKQHLNYEPPFHVVLRYDDWSWKRLSKLCIPRILSFWMPSYSEIMRCT